MNSTAINNTTATIGIHPVVKYLCFFTCFWIIIAHSAIVFCFYINKSKPWTNYSKQILSLSLNDLLLGFVCLILLVMISIEGNINFVACALTFYFFFTVLCASLYHVLAICIYRVLTLIRKPTNTQPTSVKLSVLLVALASITSVCLCAVPFIVWSNAIKDVPRCKLDYVFQENTFAMGFFVVCYLLPIFLTNVVYAVTCCKLWIIWRKIYPTATDASTTSQPTTVGNILHSKRSGVIAQRKAVGTIGVLLFFFNLCSIPLIVAMSTALTDNKVPRNLRALASNMFVLNSAISPFIYAIRTKFLRDGLKKLVRDCFYQMTDRLTVT